MDLLHNPFHILSASPRDNRLRIMELADERSLLLDSSECMQARSVLTNPRKRLSAEVAWLPGIGPKRVGEVLSLLESSPSDLLGIEKLTPIALANLLAAGLTRLSDYTPDCVADWILEITCEFEDIDTEKLGVIINEERVVSGFPEVTDLSALEAEIQERRRYYRQVFKSALDNLSSKDLVTAVTAAVEFATENGDEQGPILIDDLVDLYEVEAQGFLDKEENNIRTLIERLRIAVDAVKRPDYILAPMVNELIQVVKNWDTIAQPIQVSTKSRGLDHSASDRVSGLVRDLAIYLFNEHGKLDFSQQLTNMLQEVFAEVGKVAERTAEDVSALDDIAEQRIHLVEAEKKQTEKWRREITYEAKVGNFPRRKVSISPEGIEWKGRFWDLDSISRIRWGGTQHSVNGISTGTTYKIAFGNQSEYSFIELSKFDIYSNVVDRLWRTVGVRLLTTYLEGLRDGKRYRFGTTVISDSGIEYERKHFFSSNERIFCRWVNLESWSGSGLFCIGKKEDKKAAAVFSFQEEDNIHVLEAIVSAFFKQGGKRLSILLKESEAPPEDDLFDLSGT